MKTFNPLIISCFKAYDIRGELDVNLDETIAYRIGRAFAQYLNPKMQAGLNIVIGADVRPTSESLKQAIIRGITDAGSDVIDLGMTGTEEVYFATSFYDAIGGIEVTASHNPINYNGMKLVRENSKPIGMSSGLSDIQRIAELGEFSIPPHSGKVRCLMDKTAYIEHLMTYIDIKALKPLKLVINSGNGSAGSVVDLIANKLIQAGAAIDIVRLHHMPDSSFPNGIPNPMLSANQSVTAKAVQDNGADIGIAFDGDFDRCFFFDETGRFIDGAYVVGLLAQLFLKKHPGAAIVYDPRVVYNTETAISAGGGKAVLSASGHSFIKEAMRACDAIYGGELSAHHYFRDFNYCDSGMIPWLLIIELLSITGQPLSALVDDMMARFPISGEINFKLTKMDADTILTKLRQELNNFDTSPITPNDTDGISVDYGTWRFNVRASNTEPLIRLNVESRGDAALLAQKTETLCTWLAAQGGVKT